jgi:transcriptional regulator GlxA family with amidase domain/YHS domain-containing protein
MKLSLAIGLLVVLATCASAEPAKPAKIPVAFVISDDAVMIDFTGPWSVFESVRDGRFELYTVAETAAPVRVSGGMRIVPDYTFANAPRPKVIVIPAQSNDDAAMLDWIRRASGGAELTMSVCNGAFLLAKTGLLDGKSATAYHASFDAFERRFPAVKLQRGARFVDSGTIATAGGLSSGIDLALHVVERYYGHEVAEQTAYDLEYQGKGWTDPSSNSIYAKPEAGVVDPVCGMHVDPASARTSVYRGAHYYFCSADDKARFDADPERYVEKQ